MILNSRPDFPGSELTKLEMFEMNLSNNLTFVAKSWEVKDEVGSEQLRGTVETVHSRKRARSAINNKKKLKKNRSNKRFNNNENSAMRLRADRADRRAPPTRSNLLTGSGAMRTAMHWRRFFAKRWPENCETRQSSENLSTCRFVRLALVRPRAGFGRFVSYHLTFGVRVTCPSNV